MTYGRSKQVTALMGSVFLITGLAGCSETEAPRPIADETIEIALADVPQNVSTLAVSARDGFEMKEVLKKTREGRVYYDVEGELPGGDEIEFDILMTEGGPKIVEIQRDILWRDVPRQARVTVNKANSDKLGIARVIESVQTDDSIIYEIFVKGHTSDPRFEVHMIDGEAKLLASRWEH